MKPQIRVPVSGLSLEEREADVRAASQVSDVGQRMTSLDPGAAGCQPPGLPCP